MTQQCQFSQKLGPVALGDEFRIIYPLYQADGSAWLPAATDAAWMAKHLVDDDDVAAVLSEELGSGIVIDGSTATVTVSQADQASIDGTVKLFWSLRITDVDVGPVTVAAGTILLERMAVRT